MKYFIATVLERGRKNEHGYYAENKKEAMYLAKVKHSGIIVKVVEGTAPLEDQFKRLKQNIFSNMMLFLYRLKYFSYRA